MGNIIRSSSNGSDEQNGDFASLQYNYPPKNGHPYFASSYIMGNERFETSMPECYLFGENLDLNFLAKPTAFPYLPPQPHEPTRTLRSLINIRRESLRFVKCKDPSGEEFVDGKPGDAEVMKKESNVDGNDKKKDDQPKGKQPKGDSQLHQQSTKADAIITFSNYNPNTNYNIEFVFDSDVKCAISIYYFCFEEVKASSVSYISKNLYINSPTYFYESGANQMFSQPHHVFNPSLYNESELVFKPLDEEGNFVANNSFPFVIQCVSLEGEDPKQSHSLIATIERNQDGYILKPFKQKIFIDGLCYLMQEIYGIERKNPNPVNALSYNPLNLASSIVGGNLPTGPLGQPMPPPPPPLDDELEDGSECVICMVESRDCLILPCRHLCLCSLCADSLRFQASSCPICRSPFMALLHIKAVRRLSESSQKPNSTLNLLTNSQPTLPMIVGSGVTGVPGQPPNGEQPPEEMLIPPGYEPVSLIDALNSCSVQNERNYSGEEFRRSIGPTLSAPMLQKSDGALSGQQSNCPSLYESTHEEEEEEEDSIGGAAESIELASGAQLNLQQQSSKASSITGQAETTKLLFNEQQEQAIE